MRSELILIVHLTLLSVTFGETVDWDVFDGGVYEKCVQYIKRPWATTPESTTEKATTLPSTTPLETTPPQPVQTTTECVQFEPIYDHMLESDVWECRSETIDLNDMLRVDCQRRCVSTLGCQAFLYSTERIPRCTLFEDKSRERGGRCKLIRQLDWTLYEVVSDCRPKVCREFDTYQGHALSGCKNYGDQLSLNWRTRPKCKKECEQRPDCMAALYTFKRTPCVLYKEAPRSSPSCHLVRTGFRRNNFVLYIKTCSIP